MPLPQTPALRRLLLIVGLVLILLLGTAVLRLVPASPGVVVDVPGGAPTGEQADPGQALPQAGPQPGTVTVHVVGPVRRPGVVVLPQGARVADAVAACGGFAGDAAAGVNLARVLTDGERLDLAQPQPGAGPAAQPSTEPKIDLNTATAGELEELPGVGPALAARIIDYRTAAGPFRSVEQLREVSGIGDRRYADLADLVTAGTP